MLVLCNFAEQEQRVAANTVRANGLSYDFCDLVTGDDAGAARATRACAVPVHVAGGKVEPRLRLAQFTGDRSHGVW